MVRTGPYNPLSNNPSNITGDIIALTNQLTGSGVPPFNFGVVGNVYTDVSTGHQYQKTLDGWNPTIVLGSFSIIPDPLSLHQLNVDIIDGHSSESVQVDLGVAGSLSVGPHAALSQISLNSDGSIVTESATSAVIVADGTGNQVGIQPTQIVSAATLEVIGNTGLQLLSNSGSITVEAGANPVTIDGSTTNLNANGINYLAVQGGANSTIAVAGNVLSTESGNWCIGGYEVGSAYQGTNPFSVIFTQQLGYTGYPVTAINSSNTITDPEYLGVNESGTLSFYKPYNTLIGSPYTAPISNGTYPVDFNGMGGGFSQGSYYDSNYTIKKVSVCMNINSGTFTFGGGTSSLQVGHYVVNSAQTSFVVDYTLALSTSGAFWQQSSGNISVLVTGPTILAVQLHNAGITSVGVPNSFTIQLWIEGN